jgi:hypothetical protein
MVASKFQSGGALHLIQGLAERGLSERAIAAELVVQGFRLSRSTVHRRLQLMRKLHGDFKKKSQKYPSKISDRTKRYLVRLVRFRGKHTTAALRQELQALGSAVSKQTMLRTLHSISTLALKAPRKRLSLSSEHKKVRLHWAQAALAKRIDWSLAVFADEKAWSLDGPDSRQKIWCDTRDPLPRLKRTGVRNNQVPVWGGFSLNVVPSLCRVPRHLNSEQYCGVIKDQLLSTSARRRHTLYHDRLTAHCSVQTTTWMKAHGVKNELLPPKAADINPMENVWGYLTHIVFAGTRTYDSEESLYAAVEDAWRAFRSDKALRQRLINSMTDRLKQVVDRNGDWADF